MIKILEAFNNILAEGDFRYFSSLYDRDMFREDIIIVKKALETLNIIKEKRVNVDNFLRHIEKDTDYKEYVRLCGLYKIMVFSDIKLTQGEYNLLKEVLI